ncbi:hypothetical protein ULG90_10445 [Halopseudomonas pachastrellae]|nr:hypothetical protein ULG90_10445 [Halopseudomonas pachastrellae]
MKLGKPNLFFGVAAGNMDSMINRYTADRKVRSDDAYTAGGQGGKRPDRASLVTASAAGRLSRMCRLCSVVLKPRCAARPLRLLAGQGAALAAGRRQGRYPALWQRRAGCCRGGPSPESR